MRNEVRVKDLIVVSNRGPAILRRDDNTFALAYGAGGLAPSLAHALVGTSALWIAAPMTELEQRVCASGEPVALTDHLECGFVDPSRASETSSYRVIANEILWFLYHGIFDTVHRPIFNARLYEAWEGYRAYNRLFAEMVARHASEGATVVVNDYHLSLMGHDLAQLRPDLRTVHFSHTPFCSPDELRILPEVFSKELLAGLSSFGACGFHTRRWADAYRDCARALFGRTPTAFVAPLGVDAEALERVASLPSVVSRRDALLDELDGRRCIVRCDRIELSKNVERGFLAFEELLAKDATWHDRVVFIARMYASREDLPEYLAYRAEIEHIVERVNDRFATSSRPAVMLAIGDEYESSMAALSISDVLLVNPIRDGMNLVAKEGVLLNGRDGVLVLSREAGAFAELGKAALGISPFDVSGTAVAMHTALTMPAVERSARANKLAKRAAAHPPKTWIKSVIGHARRAPARRR